MSRIAKIPIVIPVGVKITLNSQVISIQGKNGNLTHIFNNAVKVQYIDNVLTFIPHRDCTNAWAQAGTARALLYSMLIGVTKGFTKKIHLVGVGYRAVVKDNSVNLSLGFSHQIAYDLPTGITAKCPSQTEIILKGSNKQLVGQVAADLRAYRPPEPYKGKGIRYSNEVIRTKEAKKK
ncbi:50S ribosomal protein L6 [Candidatus Profftia sp. (ex Adelges kitamiensis)]|uniref:50S ribosomal protein L6 n=1 Tax=Candidatus Profftia sp. (ex Adelges kitamiensis) TaxID=2864218 RepID=UPI001CE3940B|nr:50S ribosomal protein L6 [Candidatus Profftia sp. (ex Adelges kitamiensis)]